MSKNENKDKNQNTQPQTQEQATQAPAPAAAPVAQINMNSQATQEAKKVFMEDQIKYLTGEANGWVQFLTQSIVNTLIGGLVLGGAYKGFTYVKGKLSSDEEGSDNVSRFGKRAA